jgi:type I restriction enzyme M protein
MAIKKSELYSTLWKSCDELRGGMDASQYKDYVLVLLFVKYVSDKYGGQKYAQLNVPEDGSFAAMVALKNNKEIGDKMNVIVGNLLKANKLEGQIKVADFNDENLLGKGKEMVDRLSKLVGIFEGLDFRRNRVGGDDLLGDAYEYLMRHFATESGKSKGQFYTPAEVSRIMAKIIGLGKAKSSDQTIYDMACGSASLLLKAHDEAKGSTGFELALYGQEMDNATAGLAKMNMILHDCITAEIWQDNTLSNPYFKESSGSLMRFDYAVANPPFSTKSWSNGLNPTADEFHRFEYGVPPAKNGDFAFLSHMLASLKSTGKGGIILPHGVLFRGNAEADIRKNLVRQGYIKGIIGLPANLFYGTGIPACIIVLDKENAAARKGIFMIDASKAFIKDGNKNRLRAQDIHKIVDIFTRQTEVPKYSRTVPLEEIEKNGYNLNIPRYIDSSEAEDLQDITAHLQGGIPSRDIDALEGYWQELPAVRDLLFEAERPGYSRLKVDASEIRAAIFGHPEFTAFNQTVSDIFASWENIHTAALKGIDIGNHPKELIETLSEDLLEQFRKAPLLSAYDVYQHMLDYWDGMMQDDVYFVAQDGWVATQDGAPNTDLIPQPLIVARYFAAARDAVAQLETGREAIARQMEELDEEHGGEEGLLSDAKNDKGKITKASVKARLAALKKEDDPESKQERVLLQEYSGLIEDEAVAARKVKDAQKELDAKVRAKYSALTEDEIKALVVDDKWLATLREDVHSELDRVSQALTGRIRQLAERYATPLPELSTQVACYAARVQEHLQKMGVA